MGLLIYRCRIGLFNCGAGPKLLYRSKVVCDVACGISAVSAVCFIGILLIMAGVEPNPGPTGAYEENNPKCKNWIRVAYGYRYVKTGLTGFISGEIGRHHTRLRQKVDEQCRYVKPCSECTINTLLPDHGTLGCNQKGRSVCLCQQDPGTRKKCPNNFCGHFYHLIVDGHVKKSPRWSNTNFETWYNDHFQYAKCFLGTDTSASSVSDLDCADLLTIVINNDHIIGNSISEVESFRQCLKDQDRIFNSCNFEVTESELKDYFDHMISVLEDGKCLFEDPDAMQAVKELHKLKNTLMQLSDEDIAELLQKTSAPTYVFRYQYLLIEIGTKVIRKLFDAQVGPNFGYYLTSNIDEKNKLQDLIKKRCITAAQTRYLPPTDNNPSSTNFDISLLTCLLRNVCGMRPAGDLVWIQPSGHSVEAYIARLRECRNNLSHSDTVFISKTDFTAKWNELCEILKRLNQGLRENCRITNLQNLIDESQNLCIDENKREDFTKVINAWEKMDADVIAELKRLDQGMNRRFDNMEQTLEQLRAQEQSNHELLMTLKITVEALSLIASSNAQKLVLDAAKKYVSDGQEQTCGIEVQTAYNNLLSDLKVKREDIDSVKEGSILITFRCPTRLALENLRMYIADQMYEEKLAVLENAVSKCIMCSVKLNISIVPEHTSSALMQTDIATSKKSVVLTLKYRGSECARNAVGFLTNGSSTNTMNELSEALSRSVGEKIWLHTTVDVDQPSLDGNIALQEEQYRKYIFRYQYLLIEIGTIVMRKVFDFKVCSDFVNHLSANNNKFSEQLQSLIKAKIITADQAQYLPPIDTSPKSANMDITLLACLLRNVCGLHGQDDPVWKNPPPTDFSLEADLARLMECRNNLQHSGRVFISETDLTVKWNELSQILNRLNTVYRIPNLSSLINDAKSMDIDEQLKDRYDQVIKVWTDMDSYSDSGMEELKFSQSEVIQDQSNLNVGPSEMKHDMLELKQSQSESKDLPVVKKENVERRQTDQAEHMEEISNKQQGTKRPIENTEQTHLDWNHRQIMSKLGAHERNNPLCKNWNRVAYGYRYVKTALTGFIAGQISRRYNLLKVKVDEQCDNVEPCSGCTTYTLLPDHGTDGCNQKEKSDCLCQQDPGTRKKCPNNFCGRFYHLIVDDHVEKSPCWSNTDSTKWYDDYFQYAKCFLTTDSSASSVSDLDCAELLTIVISNEYIINYSIKEVKSFQQCWKDQDIIFNSGNFEVTDSELKDYFDHMIHVLEDEKCLVEDPDAMLAVNELHKLKDTLIQLSDEDIDELLLKTSDKSYVFRYQYLLIEIGTKVIRKLFDAQVGLNFGDYLRHNRDENNEPLIDKLADLIKKKHITAAQARFFPPEDNNPSSTNFDISLLTCLLRNVCGMRPAEDLVWIQPSGYSVEADITRLKECRNNISHSGTVFISNTDFTVKWNELCEILKRLNQGLKGNSRITNLQNLIDETQILCLDENKRKDFTKMINVWTKMDADVIAEVERLDQGMNRRFDNMEQTLEQLRGMLTKITLDAGSQTGSEEAQSLILDAAKTYASDRHEITCDPEVLTAYNSLSDMEDKDVVIDSVKEG